MKERAEIKVLGLNFVCELSAFQQYDDLAKKNGFNISIPEIGGQPHSFQEGVDVKQKPKEMRYAVPEGHVKALFSATPESTIGYHDLWEALNLLTWQIKDGKRRKSAYVRDLLNPAGKR